MTLKRLEWFLLAATIGSAVGYAFWLIDQLTF
jgi:hypothetical protein